MAHSASGLELRRQALSLRRDRSELRRCLARLLASAEDSAQHLEQWETSRALDEAPAQLAPKKRRRPEEADWTLVPRFRLAAVSEDSEAGEPTQILAVAAATGLMEDTAGACVAVLTRRFLELWRSDPVCWHQTEAVKVPLPAHAQTTLAFDRMGQDLWLVIFAPIGSERLCALETRLFHRTREGKLQLKARLQGPLAPLLAGPAVLDQAAAVAAAGAVHVLAWSPEESAAEGGRLGAVSFVPTFQGDTSLRSPTTASLAALPEQRLALILRSDEGAGELQLYSAAGHCLAFLQVGSAVCVVPPQDPCPSTLCAGLGVLLLLAHHGEWGLHVATAGLPGASEPAMLELRHLSSTPADVESLVVDTMSEGLVAYRARAMPQLLDWQQRSVQPLPLGWRPLVVSPGTVILAHEGAGEYQGFSEVVFLEVD